MTVEDLISRDFRLWLVLGQTGRAGRVGRAARLVLESACCSGSDARALAEHMHASHSRAELTSLLSAIAEWRRGDADAEFGGLGLL